MISLAFAPQKIRGANPTILLNKTGTVTAYRLPSFGTFSTNLQPVYRFGIPQQVDMSGILVDMDVVAQSLWADDNNPDISKAVGQ